MPINIHLTGCPNSCAQHYIGDIGLLGTKVSVEDDMVEGYHLFLGGGYGAEQDVGREIYRDVKAEDAPVVDRADAPRLPGGAARSPRSRSATSPERYPTEQLKEMFASQHCLRRLTPMTIPLLPESAPFTPAQRAWLNGFFAGLLGLGRRGQWQRRRRWPARGDGGGDGPRGRGRGGGRIPLARPGDADGRAAQARRGPPVRAQADGRDGAARLRRLRLSLPDLLRGDRGGRGEETSPSARPAARRRPASSRSSSPRTARPRPAALR